MGEGRRSWEGWLSGDAYKGEIRETSSHCVLRRDFLNSFRVWVKGFHRKRPSFELMLGWSSVSVASQRMWSMYLGFGGEAAGVLKLDVIDTVDTVFGQSWLAQMTEMDLFFEYGLSGMCGLFIVNVTTVICPVVFVSLFLIPFYCFCSFLSLSFALLNLSSSTHPDTFLLQMQTACSSLIPVPICQTIQCDIPED